MGECGVSDDSYSREKTDVYKRQAHIFCRPEQVKDEFLRVMDIISIVFRSMDFQNFEAQISLRDKVNREKYIGSDDNWAKAEQAIIAACAEKEMCIRDSCMSACTRKRKCSKEL